MQIEEVAAESVTLGLSVGQLLLVVVLGVALVPVTKLKLPPLPSP